MNSTASPASPLQKLRVVLAMWLKVMNHTRLRDRSVKVLQYGSQFLLGYWGAAISRQLRDQLGTMQASASTARKAFWILKSLDNASTALTQWDEGYFSNSSTIVEKLDAFENLCIMWYYWCETRIFFARSRWFGLQEKLLDGPTNLSWVLGDLAYFASSLLRLRENVTRREAVDKRLRSREIGTTSSSSSDECSSGNLLREQELLCSAGTRLQGKVWIAALELLVSAEYSGLYALATGGKRLNSTYVGALGVLSSFLILHDGVLDALDEEQQQETDRALLCEMRTIRGR